MVASYGERGRTGTERRVLVAGITHQTNRFVGGRTGIEDFEVRRGREVMRWGAQKSPLSGLLEVAREKGWDVLPAVDMSAASGPVVADAVVELFWAEFRAVADAAAQAGVDGVFLVLHGSMVSESHDDVEGEVLRRIRGVGSLSDGPICGVFDVHANFTESMGRQSDGLVSSRESSGEDARGAARDAALILGGLMETEQRPATVSEHPPIMLAPGAATTDREPMRTLVGRARQMEAEAPDVLAVNVHSGFPYADVPEAGVGFSAVTTGDLELARGALRELNVLASSMREAVVPSLMDLEEAMAQLEWHSEGPVLLVEPSDAIEAGAPGDDTRLLRALVEHEIESAGAVVNDPGAVAALRVTRLGERRELSIGGKSGGGGRQSLALEVEVVSRSDGRFVPEGEPLGHLARMLDGEQVDMGPCVLVRHGGVFVLLTSRRTPPLDLGQWRSLGVDPEELFAISVKAAAEHRPAYDPIARASYTVDLPGPCAEDLRRLPFERVSRPVYPLDVP